MRCTRVQDHLVSCLYIRKDVLRFTALRSRENVIVLWKWVSKETLVDVILNSPAAAMLSGRVIALSSSASTNDG